MCWLTFHFCNEIAEIINLKRRFTLPHNFRGFSPWAVDLVVLGLHNGGVRGGRSHRTVHRKQTEQGCGLTVPFEAPLQWSKTSLWVPHFFLFFFCSTGVCTQGPRLARRHPTTWAILPALVWAGYFRDRISWTICSGGPGTLILLISLSQVAWITGVRHPCLAGLLLNGSTTSKWCKTVHQPFNAWVFQGHLRSKQQITIYYDSQVFSWHWLNQSLKGTKINIFSLIVKYEARITHIQKYSIQAFGVLDKLVLLKELGTASQELTHLEFIRLFVNWNLEGGNHQVAKVTFICLSLKFLWFNQPMTSSL
jgi:hypothetical protein